MYTRFPVFLAVLILAGSPLTGEERASLNFIATTTEFYATPEPGSRPIGKLLVAAPIRTMEKTTSGWQRVAVPGWTQAGAERVLQAAPGLRVTRAALAKSGLEALSFGETREDPDTGQSWQRTILTGWIAPEAETAPDLETLWGRAEPLFSTRCTACHVRRVPEHYTANQWTSYIKVMGPRTGLPKGDQALIQTFLQYQSADSEALLAALSED